MFNMRICLKGYRLKVISAHVVPFATLICGKPLPQLAGRPLVLCGDQGLATPPELAEKPADAVTGVKFSLIEDAAHISCVEPPAIFPSLVINFLEGISSA
jgi:pimeloyl-ACP methyl ester carboxylesterase